MFDFLSLARQSSLSLEVFESIIFSEKSTREF